jgi:hypothetical protein
MGDLPNVSQEATGTQGCAPLPAWVLRDASRGPCLEHAGRTVP